MLLGLTSADDGKRLEASASRWKLNAIQIQLNTSQEREPWRGRSASEASLLNLMEIVRISSGQSGSVGIEPMCSPALIAFLRSVPKLIIA